MSEEEIETFSYLSQLFISAVIPVILAAVSLWLLYGYTQEYEEFFQNESLFLSLPDLMTINDRDQK